LTIHYVFVDPNKFTPHCDEPAVESRFERENLKRRKEKMMIDERK